MSQSCHIMISQSSITTTPFDLKSMTPPTDIAMISKSSHIYDLTRAIFMRHNSEIYRTISQSFHLIIPQSKIKEIFL